MIVIFVILGILVGALLNQLGTDLPARRAPTRPHCLYCGEVRPWWQWIALPASLVGQAKCRHCGKRIRWRWPITELGMAAIYVYLWLTLGRSADPDDRITMALYMVYFAIFALILITDFERRLILNIVTYPAILFALVAGFFTPGLTWYSMLIGGAIGLLFFTFVVIIGAAVFGEGAMGQGDITLATLIGLIVGFPLIIEAILVAVIIGAAISLILIVFRVRGWKDYVPYGPFLIAGGVIAMLWGYPLAEWYLQLIS